MSNYRTGTITIRIFGLESDKSVYFCCCSSLKHPLKLNYALSEIKCLY